jgi:hypothetical protein
MHILTWMIGFDVEETGAWTAHRVEVEEGRESSGGRRQCYV